MMHLGMDQRSPISITSRAVQFQGSTSVRPLGTLCKARGDGISVCIVLSYSEPGGHPANEDAFEVQRHPEGRSCWTTALADGQGGRAGGAKAARLACRIVIEAVLAQPVSRALSSRTWVAALRRADEGVLADGEAGYTTLIGFAVV